MKRNARHLAGIVVAAVVACGCLTPGHVDAGGAPHVERTGERRPDWRAVNLPVEGKVRGVVFSCNSRWVLTKTDRLQIWSTTEPNRAPKTLSRSWFPTIGAVSDDGERVLFLPEPPGLFSTGPVTRPGELVQVGTGRALYKLESWPANWTPDLKRFVLRAEGKGFGVEHVDTGEWTPFRGCTHEQLRSGPVTRAAATWELPWEAMVVKLVARSVSLWEIEDGCLLSQLRAGNPFPEDAEVYYPQPFSPDENWHATRVRFSDTKEDYYLWNLRTRRATAIPQCRSVEFLPDGRRAVALVDFSDKSKRALELWDLHDTRKLAVFRLGTSTNWGWTTSASHVFKGDQMYGRTIHSFNSGEQTGSLDGMVLASLPMDSLLVELPPVEAPRGRRNAPWATYGPVRICSGASGEELMSLGDEVYMARVSPDGRHILTVDSDFTARLWTNHADTTPSDSWLRVNCDRYPSHVGSK